MKSSKTIYVFADWLGLPDAELIGELTVNEVRGKEVFSFSYHDSWLQNTFQYSIDPDLHLYPGTQYQYDENKPNFGIFLDSAPDRWGRVLMKRREPHKRFLESDYLLGVYDGNRMGGLRFKLDLNGDFLDNNHLHAAPPWSSLRELEAASLALEDDNSFEQVDYAKWLELLIAPGSSLGGARPKANVVDDNGEIWIAKFPSKNDHYNIGLWEYIVNTLARTSGLNVPSAQIHRFNSKYHTYFSKRFDRNFQKRIHFVSAMTLTGHVDGTDNASYLEIAETIIRYSSNTKNDLLELWKRMLFNIFVSNTDDHLRNHGFLYDQISGWRLSPAYDMNPNRDGNGLSLNINFDDNAQDIDLLMTTAKEFRLKAKEAYDILSNMRFIIKEWQSLAISLGANREEIEYLKKSFRLANGTNA